MHDWALLREKKERGEKVAEEEEARIRDGMAEFGDLFLTKAGRTMPVEARPLPPKNYHKNWYGGRSVKDLFEGVTVPGLYERPYRWFSEWHHWDLAGLARSMSWDSDGTHLTGVTRQPSPGALAIGIQCLLQTAALVEKYIPVGLDEALRAFRDEYVAESKDLGGRAIV